MTEPLSAAVGAISLIGKACGAYSRTTVLISTYKHFDKNLNTVLINIETAEIIFYVAIRVLLSEGLGEIRAKEMMSNLWSNHWKEEHLEQQLCSQLGILRARAIANSVRSSTRVLEEIEEKLSKKPFNISKETTLEILVSKVASSIISMEDPRILERLRRFQPEGQRIITIKSRREKLGAVFGDIITELEALHMALRGHNDDLEQLRNQSNNQRTSRNTQSPLPLGVPLTPVPGSLVSKAAEALKLHLMQTASKELHGLVLGRLEVPCQCHKLHLCLGDLAAPTDDDVLEDSNADPGRKNAQFYFWLPGSATNGGSKSINTQSSCEIAGPWDADPAVPSLIFSGRLIKPEEQLLVDDLIPPVDLYQKLRNDQFEFRSYASDHSRVEFHLRRTSSVQPFSSIQASHLEPPSDYSIDKLISLDRQMLSNIDIAEISANLAKSVLFFYNSPWIRNWSMDTIRFYGHTSDSTCPRWVPHILVTFSNGDSNQDHFGATSRAIRQLGHILLQIGRKERLDRRHGETDAALLKRALVDLRTTMGTDYKKAVRNFICQWGSEGLDIMEDCHLAGFLSDLGTFERYYKPE